MTRAIVLISFFIVNVKAYSQSFLHEYSKSIGSASDYDWISDIGVDHEGNTVSVGYFSGQVDFDSSPNENIKTANGIGDGFIAKHDPFGNLIWVQTFGNAELETVNSVAFDSQNNIVITGRITGTVDLNPGTGVSLGTSNYQAYYCYVSKFTSQGEFVWTYFTPDYQGSQGIAIEVDSNDSPILYREVFTNSGDLNVTKLSQSGEVIFSLDFGGPSYDYPSDMVLDNNGNIILSGHHSYSNSQVADLDPGQGVYNVGGFGSFILKLDNNGVFVFANDYTIGKGNNLNALATDSNNSIFCLGSSSTSADLDLSSEGIFLTPNGPSSYLFRLDAFGNFVSGNLFNIGPNAGVTWSNLEIDLNNEFYLSGEFYGTIDVDFLESNDVVYSSSNPVNFDIVLVKYNSELGYLSSSSFGNNMYCDSRNSCVNDLGDFWVVGNYNGTFNFNSNNFLYNLNSQGQRDAYIVKFSTCIPLVWYQDLDGDGFGSSVTLESCVQPNGYTSVSGDFDDSSANLNPNALELCNEIDDNGNGTVDEGFDNDNDGYTICSGDSDDSNFNVNPGVLEICNGVDDNSNGVIDEGFDLDADGYTVCEGDNDDNNNAVNPGAMEICNGVDDNCDGTIDEGFDSDLDGFTFCQGDCDDNNQLVNPLQVEIPGNGIDENCDGQVDNDIIEIEMLLSLFPNPARTEMNLQISSDFIGEDLFIFDALGKLVFDNRLVAPQSKIDISNFSEGNYLIRVGSLVKQFEVVK